MTAIDIPEDVMSDARKQCDRCGVTAHSDMRTHAEFVAAFAILAEREKNTSEIPGKRKALVRLVSEQSPEPVPTLTVNAVATYWTLTIEGVCVGRETDRRPWETDRRKRERYAALAYAPAHLKQLFEELCEKFDAPEKAAPNLIERVFAVQSAKFGDRQTRTAGVVQHIHKEADEAVANPSDLVEWADIILLAIDGYRRNGGKADELLPLISDKLDIVEARNYPDPYETPDDVALEHERAV